MEVGLRDGLQNIRGNLSIEDRLFIIEGLIEAGITNIQIASFVNPKKVPQMAFAEDLEEEQTPLKSDDTWIVSGGGSGVTAASIIGVACNSLNAGAHFALLGRSQLLEETESWVEWSEAQLNQQKASLREELISTSDTGKVTMVEWNNAWQKFSRSRDVYITIKTIEEIKKIHVEMVWEPMWGMDMMSDEARLELGFM